MRGSLVILMMLALSGCGATPEQLLTGFGGAGIASIAIIHRSPFDAAYSLITGRDCSIVWLDENKPYCRPEEPAPPPQRYCTRSLGAVDCWAGTKETTVQQQPVADGPQTLTAEQEANRTRTWP
jgi:hypothetical protein